MDRAQEILTHDDFQICGFFGEFRFLSNFESCPVWFEGVKYPSSENAYQAAKVQPDFREEFITCTAGKSKKLWKTLPALYTSEQWDLIKTKIMARVLVEKFLSNKDMGDLLKSTEDKYLEETNWWGDTFWGTIITNKELGVKTGYNNLGRLLMTIRDL
jgi:ribA/ribD-fused uncharacterized protein